MLYVQARHNGEAFYVEKRRKSKRVYGILGHSIYQENPPGGRASNKQTNKHSLFRHRTSQKESAYQESASTKTDNVFVFSRRKHLRAWTPHYCRVRYGLSISPWYYLLRFFSAISPKSGETPLENVTHHTVAIDVPDVADMFVNVSLGCVIRNGYYTRTRRSQSIAHRLLANNSDRVKTIITVRGHCDMSRDISNNTDNIVQLLPLSQSGSGNRANQSRRICFSKCRSLDSLSRAIIAK